MKWNCEIILVIAAFLFFLTIANYAYAIPIGATATYVNNSTTTNLGNATLNYSGGSIVTFNFVSNEQNTRWKAFVGNVSGTLKLADSDGYSIYEWDRATTAGEVYATRTPNTISWAAINCSTFSQIVTEENAIGHTANPNDNISSTFNESDNTEFYVGTERINANTCNTTNLNINSTRDASDDFEEMILNDGTYTVFAAIIENDISGYKNGTWVNETYDFQIMVPENATSGSTQLAYYFYVELT